MLKRLLFEGVVAEDGNVYRGVAQVFAALDACYRYQPRRNAVALHNLEHALGYDTLEKAVDPF